MIISTAAMIVCTRATTTSMLRGDFFGDAIARVIPFRVSHRRRSGFCYQGDFIKRWEAGF